MKPLAHTKPGIIAEWCPRCGCYVDYTDGESGYISQTPRLVEEVGSYLEKLREDHANRERDRSPTTVLANAIKCLASFIRRN
jgi:hypothetical protein